MQNATPSTLFQVTTLTVSEARYAARYYRSVAMIHEGTEALIAGTIADAIDAFVAMETAWPSNVDAGAGALTAEGTIAMAQWAEARERCERASRLADYMIARI